MTPLRVTPVTCPGYYHAPGAVLHSLSPPMCVRNAYVMIAAGERTSPWVISCGTGASGIVALMTYFPQSNPAKPAHRVKLQESVLVAIRVEGAHSVRAKLHEISATGGLLILAKPLEQGEFVEVAFQTSEGSVHGLRISAERLAEGSRG